MAVRLKAMGTKQYRNVVESGSWSGQMAFSESQLNKPLKIKKAKVKSSAASKKTKAFISGQKRLHVFYLPPYSPDFSPDEWGGTI